ncbi:MAG: pilus assembly protein [Marmoricola sp.]|nr:pilus assembly protein [Marmoricola sp.]
MPGRKRSDRGAVAVEAALVTPILMLLVFGIIEMSLLMRDAAGVNNQVRAGARIAATEAGAGLSSANNPALAVDAVTAIQNAGSSMPLDSVNWVLVYQANQYGYPMPTSNQTSMTCTTNCIKYVWNAGSNAFVRQSGTWDTSQINACVNDANRQSVGVAMSARHTWITGLFGSGVDVPARLMMQFEPLPATTCAAGKHS